MRARYGDFLEIRLAEIAALAMGNELGNRREMLLQAAKDLNSSAAMAGWDGVAGFAALLERALAAIEPYDTAQEQIVTVHLDAIRLVGKSADAAPAPVTNLGRSARHLVDAPERLTTARRLQRPSMDRRSRTMAALCIRAWLCSAASAGARGTGLDCGSLDTGAGRGMLKRRSSRLGKGGAFAATAPLATSPTRRPSWVTAIWCVPAQGIGMRQGSAIISGVEIARRDGKIQLVEKSHFILLQWMDTSQE